MTDTLIARLRDWRGDPDEVMSEAADRIEALQARLTALESQEPVAWIIGMTESAPMITSNKAFAHGARDIDGRDIKPLFLAAGAAPTKEQT